MIYPVYNGVAVFIGYVLKTAAFGKVFFRSDSDKVARPPFLNSIYETGFSNPIDKAMRQYRSFNLKNCAKPAEIPYDFYRV